MKRQLLRVFIIFISLVVYIQVKGEARIISGIQWTNGLSWDEIKIKAKQENKYIFLDCFATWCGPCKMMDRNVYLNDTVGNYFNEHFISVKVQMDKTENDNKFIQEWYADAASIYKQYRIEVFPTFLFLNPQGEIVHQAVGYKKVGDLIAMAQTAIKPGQVYKNPYAAYDSLVVDYKVGRKYYNRMPYMVKIAYKIGDDEFGKQLLNEHTNYVAGLSPEQRYTKENIQLWSSFILRSSGPRFEFFNKDGDFIDKVMNQKGYAQGVVDNTILHEIVDSFYQLQPGETTLITGRKVKNKELMFMGQLAVRRDGKIMSDNVEADWKKLEDIVKQKFDRKAAKRIVLSARIQWYEQHRNYSSFAKYTLVRYKKYPPNLFKDVIKINSFAWDVFLYVTDKKLLKRTMTWQKKAVEYTSKWKSNSDILDTYANLLYKLGKNEDAVYWQEMAVNKSQDKDKIDALEKMKRGERTYTNQGAIWE